MDMGAGTELVLFFPRPYLSRPKALGAFLERFRALPRPELQTCISL